MRQRGFTLLEVMIALALLGLGLVVLMKSAANNLFSVEEAHMMGVATDLARGKMYDIEEILLKDGFSDSDQSHESEECFEDEGWSNICYSYKVEEPTMPTLDQLQSLQERRAQDAAKLGSAAGSAAGSALGSAGGLENSTIGGLMSMFSSADPNAAAGGALLQSQYSMFQDILKTSVRKVTLTVKWKVLGRDRDMKVVAFFTDAAAADKSVSNLLAAFGALGGSGGSGGTGTGSGSGSGTTGGTGTPGGTGTTKQPCRKGIDPGC